MQDRSLPIHRKVTKNTIVILDVHTASQWKGQRLEAYNGARGLGGLFLVQVLLNVCAPPAKLPPNMFISSHVVTTHTNLLLAKSCR